MNHQMKRRKSRTNVNGSSGRPKNKSLESIDRISFLPDSILGIILSFLPTKNAVSTTVLSKRWKLVWTTVHNLDLCYEDSLGKQDERDDMRFVGFVNRVLLHHDAGRLNKFRLVWTPRCISSHATSWISTAISKNVHELFLRLETNTLVKNRFALYLARTSPEPFVMPICVFNCTMLRFLELDGGISVSESIVVCLPKLETIKLVSVYFQSEEAFEKLIRGCPVLINLIIMTPYGMLNEFFQDDGFTCIISSTSLRRLEIRHEYETDRDLLTNLKLEASSLEYLTLYGVVPAFLVQKSLSSLVEAKFDIDLDESYSDDADICNSVVEAVRMLDCAKALILSASTIWALSCATIRLSTEFKRLVKLETKTYCCACSSLQDFIQCSDNLEVLRIHQVPECVGNEYDHDHSNWTTPVEVPRCLSTSLKKVVLDNYYGNEDEREMIRYMLLRGSALEVMQISCDTRFKGPKLEMVQEICEFSRKLSSKFRACEAKFDGGHQSATPRCCNHHSAIEFYWSLLNHNESQVWMKGMDVLG